MIVAEADFWNPIEPSWELWLLLIIVLVLLTAGSTVWWLLTPDEPEMDTKELVDKAVARDRERARTISRRQDADTGRADTSEPELR